MSTVLTAFAAVIAVGVVYNNARIALAERTWELASVRVLGFTRGEVSALLLGELAISIAVALPLGMLLGEVLVQTIAELLKSDQFYFDPAWDLGGAIDDLQLYFDVLNGLAGDSDFPEWYPGNEFRPVRERSRAGAAP